MFWKQKEVWSWCGPTVKWLGVEPWVTFYKAFCYATSLLNWPRNV